MCAFCWYVLIFLSIRFYFNFLNVLTYYVIEVNWNLSVQVDKCCRALTERLGDKEYFFGNKWVYLLRLLIYQCCDWGNQWWAVTSCVRVCCRPCELDALVFGHVFALVTTELPCGRLAATVKAYPELLALAARVENNYFKKKPEARLKNA